MISIIKLNLFIEYLGQKRRRTRKELIQKKPPSRQLNQKN
jgi:hypothetical protein